MNNIRSQVLKHFKNLHRTRITIFDGDSKALQTARMLINLEYRKNKDIQDENKILEMLKLSESVEKELRETVIQAKEVAPGKFEAKIKPETLRIDNQPYKTCQ